MSKEIKKHRLGAKRSTRRRVLVWIGALLVCGGGGWAAYRYTGTTEIDVPVAKVRRGDFVISVRSRSEIRATRSVIISAPQVPEPRVVKLAENGKTIRKGEVVVEFDPEQQRQNFIERDTSVRTADSEIVQAKAQHKITNEQDSMSLMQAEYNVERAKLEASKAEIVSEIEGAKNRIQVGVSEGELKQVQTVLTSRKVSQTADIERLDQKKDKTIRDKNLAQGYLSKMIIRAPVDGIVNVLPNFRSGGSWGQSPPAFKEGDRAWTGAAIAEIPDLSEMRIELKLEEVDRGRIKLDQQVRIRVDAIPDREFEGKLDWISPIASLVYKGFGNSEKLFPARATLKSVDPRLRPGMSASAEIIIERYPNALLIPLKASFSQKGKPSVYVQKGQQFQLREIKVGQRNDEDLVVTGGLKENELVTLENPMEAARRARKKL